MRTALSLLLALSVATAAALPASAEGEFMTGKTLKAGLEGWVSDTSEEIVRDAAAFGYVVGVHDALSGSVVCSGEDVTQGEVVKAVLRFMRDRPDTLDKSADLVVGEALKRVWPCKGG